MIDEDLVDIVTNIHQFNQDLTNLNIKYAETIEEQKQEIKAHIEFNKYLQKEIIRLTNSIKEAIDYINNHQLVIELSSKKQIAKWFDMFYKEVLEILYKGIDKE